MTDNRGWYKKFNVVRTDGTDAPGEKHHGCEYLVLDMTHDPHAVAAVRAYVVAIRDARPELAKALGEWADIQDTARPATDGAQEEG